MGPRPDDGGRIPTMASGGTRQHADCARALAIRPIERLERLRSPGGSQSPTISTSPSTAWASTSGGTRAIRRPIRSAASVRT